ncbi:uncharacterized protein Tco_1397523 [Tanacetum coccineum]
MSRRHLIEQGFDKEYTYWNFHGESQVDSHTYVSNTNREEIDSSDDHHHDNIDEMLRDVERDVAKNDIKKLQQLRIAQKDGKMRHVADSPQWKNIDQHFDKFGSEIRNMRFRLSLDGINPFRILSTCHSTWTVLLCIYNLPPWLCMKRKYIMMSLLIQGPKQPRNDIDVYLEPLMEDMKKLWDSALKFMMRTRKRCSHCLP